jgi:trigger factor
MTTRLEQLSALERRLSMAVPAADIDAQVRERLLVIARSAKLPGFRPGKVPMRMIEQSYGSSVKAEILGDAVSKAFSAAVEEHKLRLAGEPRIVRDEHDGVSESLGFSATFEVYPEVRLGEIAGICVLRPTCVVGDDDVDRTIEVLRKQRVTWRDVLREAADDDRVTVDFVGTLDGAPFEGGTASDFPFVLGEGRMLAGFEAGVRGARPGEQRDFAVDFPADYGSPALAGQTVQFHVTVQKVEAPVLPAVDADFARQFGIAEGDVLKLRADILANLEREVAQRLRARVKSAVMEVLPAFATLDLPRALVDAESSSMAERAKLELRERGIDIKDIAVPVDSFTAQAEKRVRLGLIVAEIVKQQGLQAKPDQIRRQIEEFAQSYENPAEVIRHYFSDRHRLAEVEALVVEQNVVDWVLRQATVTDEPIDFDDLMKNV